jgi:peptidylprolyl isomerase
MFRGIPVTLLVLALAAVASAQTLTANLAAPADVAAPPSDAVTGTSGLASKVVTPGSSSEKALATDVVTVHYTGWTPDGKVVDSTWTRGVPATFPLNRSLLGWRECVQLMTVGEKRRCWVPQSLAYNGQPGRPAGMVVFDIELLETRRSPSVPPPDVAAPPADAKRHVSGLSYKVLKPGTGTRKPTPYGRVIVHYTGWTTDGKMFDSSLTRGTPDTLSLDSVIKGWTEGLQLMVEGERTRFWIPQNLAYKGEPGSPRGMLVFDVELIRIE